MIIERVGKVVLDTTLDGLGRSSARILMTTGELLYHIVGMGPTDESVTWKQASQVLAGHQLVINAEGCWKGNPDVTAPAYIPRTL
jgi:hypothetical protein